MGRSDVGNSNLAGDTTTVGRLFRLNNLTFCSFDMLYMWVLTKPVDTTILKF